LTGRRRHATSPAKYPVLRLAKEFWVHRNAPHLGPFGIHVSRRICWPHDLDVWLELNNGRTLTIFDFGRFVLIRRVGVDRVLREQGWGGTVAGSSVRHRRRIRAFDRFEMRTRLLGWDARFFYVEQGLWRHGACASHILLRTAITDAQGLVGTGRVAAAEGIEPTSPPLPGWVAAWCEAEAHRPWPPPLGDAVPVRADSGLDRAPTPP
jgi:acyl-CoA thioesterase FadM